MDRVNLNYYFGTGGFYALWIILLGTDYRCKFKNDDRSLDEIYKDHWNINCVASWNSTEIWPDNERSTDLLYYCNGADKSSTVLYNPDIWNNQIGKRLVIYTDIETQFKLAKAKKVGAFDPNKNINIEKLILDCYNNIKAINWPTVTSYEQLHDLQDYQKAELEEKNLKIYREMFKTFVHLQSYKYNNKRIYQAYNWCTKIHEADIACDLLDIISTNGGCLLEPLGYKTNQAVTEFTNMYKELNKGLL